MPEPSIEITKPSYNTKEIRSQVTSLAWPVMAEMFLQTFAQIVSMILVGRLGATAVTSIGLSMQPLNLFYGVFMGIGVGVTAIVARLYGAGDTREASKAAAQGVMLSAIIALLGAVLVFFKAEALVIWMGAEPDVVRDGTRYLQIMIPGLFFMWCSTVLTGALRGAGDTRTPMKVNMVISVINFAGNLLLVYGLFGLPAMGVLGAGLATTLARFVGGVMLFAPYLVGRSTLPVDPRQDFRWNKDLMARIARISVPAGGERFIMSGSSLFYARMVAGLGSASYAAHTIGINAESLSYMPGSAFAVAATTLVGQNLGAERPDLAERSTYESLFLSCVLVGTLGLVFLFFPESLMSLYTKDPEVISLGAIYLKIMAFCQIHQAFGFVFMGAIRGTGDTKFALWVTAFCSWALRLGITYWTINILKTGVVGAWWAMAVDGLVKAIASWMWFRVGRWKAATL